MATTGKAIMHVGLNPEPAYVVERPADATSVCTEDEAVCCVCLGGESVDDNPIVFCDGCDIAVHKECYGNPLMHEIPDDAWFCARCKFQEQDAPCVLCGGMTGAMKRTCDFRWAHIACALWIPEVFFLDGEGREPIDYYRIPDKRFEQTCMYCKRQCGACVQCSEHKCEHVFHISCGLDNKVCLEYKQSTRKGEPDIIVSFCHEHADEARKRRNWKMKFYARE